MQIQRIFRSEKRMKHRNRFSLNQNKHVEYVQNKNSLKLVTMSNSYIMKESYPSGWDPRLHLIMLRLIIYQMCGCT